MYDLIDVRIASLTNDMACCHMYDLPLGNIKLNVYFSPALALTAARLTLLSTSSLSASLPHLIITQLFFQRVV